MSITRRLHRRRRAPHAFAEGLGLGFGMLELVEPCQRHPRRDARQALAHHDHVRADTVFGDDIREPPLVDIEALAVALEPDPPPQHQPGQLVARRQRKRRRRVEHAADLRRVDAEQPDAAEPGDINRVAVDDRAHHHELRSLQRTQRRRGNYCNHHTHGRSQKLHRHLLLQQLAEMKTSAAKRQPQLDLLLDPGSRRWHRRRR